MHDNLGFPPHESQVLCRKRYSTPHQIRKEEKRRTCEYINFMHVQRVTKMNLIVRAFFNAMEDKPRINFERVHFNPMKLRVKSISDQITVIDGISDTGSMLQVFEKVKEGLGIEPDFQRILFAGKELKMEQTVPSTKLFDNAIIHLVIRAESALHPPSGPKFIEKDQNDSNDFNPFRTYATLPEVVIEIPQNEPQPTLNGILDIEGGAGGLLALSRAVQLFSIGDCVVTAFSGLWYPMLLPLMLCSLTGYFGAVKMVPRLLLCYQVFLVLSVFLRVYLIRTAEDAEHAAVLVMGCVLGIGALSIVNKFYTRIKSLDSSQLEFLSDIQNRNNEWATFM